MEYSKLNLVQDLGDISENYTATIPNQVLTEADKFKDKGLWFAQNLRYVASFYNRPLSNVPYPKQFEDNPGRTNESLNTPVMNMYKDMLYYLGKQPNLNYAHLTKNVDNSNLQVTWRKGQEIPPLIDHMKGNANTLLQNMKFSCVPMSEDAFSERTQMYNNLMATLTIKDELNRLAKLGVTFNPVDGFSPETQEEIDKWIASGAYKIKGSEYATAMADNIWQSGFCESKFLQAYTYAIVCGLGGIERCINNGRLEHTVIMPYQLIPDIRIDDDYNRHARFVGVVRNLTPNEVFRKNPQFTKKQKEDLMNIAQNQSMQSQYNLTNTNFTWWSLGNGRLDATVTEVSAYWICEQDLGVKKYTNKYGIEQISAAPKDQPGGFTVDAVHCATIYGNKYLTNYGYCDNVSEDIERKHRPQLPIQVWMPNMIGGESRSLVSRLHAIQDEIDAYRFVQKKIIASAMGKVLFIRGDKFGNSTSAKEILQDLKAMQVTVLTTSGEANEQADSERAVEQVDLTLDPNFMRMTELIIQLKSEMQEIISTNRVSLGQQQTYIGQAQQAKSISQSSLGQSALIDGFMEFVRLNMQMDLNILKNLWASNEDELNAAVTVGDTGVQYFKATKDVLLEDFLLFIHVKDLIDENSRNRILAYGQAASQNPNSGVSMLDLIKLEKSKTFTEACEILEKSIKASKMDAAKQQEMMAKIEEQKVMLTQQSIAQQQQNQQIATLVTKITELDRKGMWSVREKEVDLAASIIEAKTLEKAPPLPQQAVV